MSLWALSKLMRSGPAAGAMLSAMVLASAAAISSARLRMLAARSIGLRLRFDIGRLPQTAELLQLLAGDGLAFACYGALEIAGFQYMPVVRPQLLGNEAIERVGAAVFGIVVDHGFVG